MFNYEKCKTTLFSGKYVNGIAKVVLLDFSKHSYIIKGSTGIGATTAILNCTDGNYIIISPNVGMIRKKAMGKYKSHEQVFIYSKSHDNWKDVETYLNDIPDESQNLIINTTAEQMLKIKSMRPELFERLKSLNVFVDEIHAFAQDSSYRKSLGEFMELVYSDWQGKFKISTATPVYNGIDIPKDLSIEYHKLERENEPMKPVWISDTHSDYKDFVYRELNQGRKVVVFSNNINVHKDFKEQSGLNMVGKNLKIKLAPYGKGQKTDSIKFDDYNVLILSSSYFAGYDLEMDCSICVVSEQRTEAYKINILNFVQAYGRCRGKVHNALYINIKADKDTKGQAIYYPKTQDEALRIQNDYEQTLEFHQSKVEKDNNFGYSSDFITKDGYVNRLLLLQKPLTHINDYFQYNEDSFNRTLESYNFVPSNYQSSNDKYTPQKRVVFKDRIAYLAQLPTDELFNGYSDIKKGLKYKDNGSFNYDIALTYLTVYLLKLTNADVILEKLNKSKNLKPCEFYRSVDLFFRANVDSQYYFHQLSAKEAEYGLKNYKDELVSLMLRSYVNYTNDWQFLYAINCYKKQGFSPAIERVFDIYREAHNLYYFKDFQNDKKHRVDKALRVILKALKGIEINLSNDEKKWLKELCKGLYKRLDKGKETPSFSRKYITDLLADSLGYLLVGGSGNHRSKMVKYREYYPLIHLPREMRCLIPLKYLSIDLDSANPQIVDSIIGSKIGLELYGNLMANRCITRLEAKKLYNTYLNRHYLSYTDAVEFYLECGYSQDESMSLAKLTTNVERGKFYERMTENEEILMENYNRILSTPSHRFHDALIVKMEAVEDNLFGLPSEVEGYRYHINLFNDGSKYEGWLIKGK